MIISKIGAGFQILSILDEDRWILPTFLPPFSVTIFLVGNNKEEQK
jgi:hypothetical protein